MSDNKTAVKRLVFLTGTRADFGKLKSLLRILDGNPEFEIHLFVTGMHMLSKYGYTCIEVESMKVGKIYKFINQNLGDTMDMVLAKTVTGLSDYVKETKPDMILVHGDRVEALAGAIVGSLNNILVSHIEGGEVSGTIDELIRHSVSKLSHVHFVANEEAKRRLIQMGEAESSIHIIGSPDMDIMKSPNLPSMGEVRQRYGIDFERYGILMFHPVTTEFDSIGDYTRVIVDAINRSSFDYVVIYPNNDHGSSEILREYRRLEGNPRIKMYPSMRFEYFLTLMKNCEFVIGNSSAGVREAPYYGKPTVNIGNRQFNRVKTESIVNCGYDEAAIIAAIQRARSMKVKPVELFGDGSSDRKFAAVLGGKGIWTCEIQKYFIDR